MVRKIDYRIILTVAVSLVFGVLLSKMLPIFARNPLFLLVLPAGMAFFLFLVMRPKETLILLLLTRPLLDQILNLTKITAGGTQFSAGVFLNLAILFLGVFMAFYYKGFPKNNLVTRWWTIYLVVLLAASLYSPYLGQSVRYAVNQLTYFMMFLIPFFIVKERKDFIFWLKVLAMSFVPAVLCADINMLQGGKYFPDAGNRVIGTFTHPNILAFYLVLGLTVYFYILKEPEFKMTRNVAKMVKIVMLNMAILLIGTKTRNAWIACFLVFLLYGFLKDKKLMFTMLLLIPLSLAIPTVRDRVFTVVDAKAGEYKGMNSFEWRVHMWTSSFSKIAERPIQGYGLTTFKPMSEEFSDVGENGAHSVYIELMFESGLLGLGSFLFLFWSVLSTFLKNVRETTDPDHARLWAIFTGYLISYILICSADNLLYYLAFNWYVWFFIGLAMVSKKFQALPSQHLR